MQATDSAPTGAPEPAKNASAPARAQRRVSARRKLNDEQEREVTRLYSQTDTPVPEISKRFGIGESSVYRVVERHGGQLRGRAPRTGSASATATRPAATATPAAAQRGARGGRRRTATATRAARTSTPATTDGRASTAAAAKPTPATTRRARTTGRGLARAATAGRQTRATATRAAARVVAATTIRFRIAFVAETTIVAVDMRDALRQAEAMGATEVTSVTRA